MAIGCAAVPTISAASLGPAIRVPACPILPARATVNGPKVAGSRGAPAIGSHGPPTARRRRHRVSRTAAFKTAFSEVTLPSPGVGLCRARLPTTASGTS